MKKLLLFALPLCILLLTECKKSSTDPGSGSKTYLIKGLKTIENGSVIDTVAYAYDSSDRIVEYTDNSGGLLLDNKLTYDGNDHVTEVDNYSNGSLVSKVMFTYGTGTAAEQITTYTNGNVIGNVQATITLNSDQQMLKKTYDANTYYVYAYDASGNLSTFTQYQGSGNSTPSANVTTYAYDTYKSIYANVKGNYYIWFDKYTPYSITSQVNGSVSYTFINTYNTDGYLTSRLTNTTGLANHATDQTTYTYIVK